MLPLQRLFRHLQSTRWFGLFILPYYFVRFVLGSIRERGLWFYRYPMGHYGSTIPSKRELLQKEEMIFSKAARTIPGVDLNLDYQLELLRDLSKYDRRFPLTKGLSGGGRYYSDNFLFRSTDALTLYCMLRHFKSRQVIEIGSGFSSALMLDIKESDIPDLGLTFIEPYPATLNSLLRKNDGNLYTLIKRKIQDVPLELFDQMAPSSILFIDSSHVLKIGSDLSTIMFSILPRLQPGVLVHFHDIHWPFEYPMNMIYEGRAWNENYFVRSFLQFNNTFEIVFFTSYLQQVHGMKMHAYPAPRSGSSLWLRRK
jgi:hypothetical protein